MLNVDKIDFEKLGGLIPVCVQDYRSMQVLMIGFMNKQALKTTLITKKITFWSRSKGRLWTKGETSGNSLLVVDALVDCDCDSLLIYAKALGPTCHTGSQSCFKDEHIPPMYYLAKLMAIVEDRHQSPKKGSYTSKLFKSGTKRIAQKVAEEGVETALAAVCEDNKELAQEVADLLFHLLVLLEHQGLDFQDVIAVLKERMV